MKTVYNKEELKKALQDKERKIIIKGKLALQIRTQAKVQKVSKGAAIGFGIVSLATAPFSGGTSLAGLVASATVLTGGQIIIIIAILCGFTLGVIGLLKEYNVEFCPNGTVILTRN